MNRISISTILILATLILLAGCGSGDVSLTLESGRTATPELLALTREATLTRVETATPTMTATPTTTIEAPPSGTPTKSAPVMLDEVGCTNRVEFIRDVTIPDGTYLTQGETFNKTWRLRNSGSCTWNHDYAYFFAGGKRMGAYEALPMPGTVAPGKTIDLTLAMTAPGSSGVYEGDWMLRNAAGVAFGIGPQSLSPFWVRIEVGASSTQALATPVSDTPAAGICGEAMDQVVTMTINPDIPDPRCVVVHPGQYLRVVNGRDEQIVASLGRLSAEIAAGGEYTFDTSFGELLLPGVHPVGASLCCSGSVWLKEQ